MLTYVFGADAMLNVWFHGFSSYLNCAAANTHWLSCLCSEQEAWVWSLSDTPAEDQFAIHAGNLDLADQVGRPVSIVMIIVVLFKMRRGSLKLPNLFGKCPVKVYSSRKKSTPRARVSQTFAPCSSVYVLTDDYFLRLRSVKQRQAAGQL